MTRAQIEARMRYFKEVREKTEGLLVGFNRNGLEQQASDLRLILNMTILELGALEVMLSVTPN